MLQAIWLMLQTIWQCFRLSSNASDNLGILPAIWQCSQLSNNVASLKIYNNVFSERNCQMDGFQSRASDTDACYLAMLQAIGNLAGHLPMLQTIWQCSQLSDSAPSCLTMLPAVSKCSLIILPAVIVIVKMLPPVIRARHQQHYNGLREELKKNIWVDLDHLGRRCFSD